MTGLGALLDRSIVFSFDRTGYRRHARSFRPGELDVDAADRIAVVTGASSGIGLEVARGLLARGARVVLAVRNVEKGERVRGELGSLGARAEVRRLDVSDLASVRRFAAELPGAELDLLVHNAGSLVDREERTADGLELTVATHLVGPLLLSHLLWPRLRASRDGRLIHVASGGLYAERLEVSRLLDGDGGSAFDGVRQYARAKRAQLVITEEIARRAREGGARVVASAMHPGWADTPGVRTALPRFFAVTRRILRTPAEGADTVLFLALAERAREAAGRFYFDRAPAPAHLRTSTHEAPAERARLWSRLATITQLPADAFA